MHQRYRQTDRQTDDRQTTDPDGRWHIENVNVKFTSAKNDGTTLQEDLDKLSSWSEIWQLKFNAEKCKVMHIGHSYRTEYYVTEDILGKRKLESVQEERDLGLIIRSEVC